MKKLVLALAILASSVCSLAQPVQIAENTQNEEWIGFPESFTKIKDAYSILISKRRTDIANPEETRAYFAVSFDDCKRGYGNLYIRDDTESDWRVATVISTKNLSTVGDQIGSTICETGTLIDKNRKSKKHS